MDWHSRRLLAGRVSNTLKKDFCIDALDKALAHHGPPGSLSSDHGCPFAGQALTAVLKAHRVQIGMDCKCYRDTIFMERLWRRVKGDRVYQKAFKDGAPPEARARTLLRLVQTRGTFAPGTGRCDTR